MAMSPLLAAALLHLTWVNVACSALTGSSSPGAYLSHHCPHENLSLGDHGPPKLPPPGPIEINVSYLLWQPLSRAPGEHVSLTCCHLRNSPWLDVLRG